MVDIGDNVNIPDTSASGVVLAVTPDFAWVQVGEVPTTVHLDDVSVVKFAPTVGELARLTWAFLPVKVLFLYAETATVAYVEGGNVSENPFVVHISELVKP